MDIQSKVAARRAEITRQEREAAQEERERKSAEDKQLREQRRARLDALAAELSTAGTPLRREGDDLLIAEESPLHVLDASEFKKNALERLLAKEARRRFSPQENWYVIGPIAAGAALLLSIPLLGLLLVGAGVLARFRTLNRYRQALVSEFPKLFGVLH